MSTASTPHLLEPYRDIIANMVYVGLLPFFMGSLGPWILASYEAEFSTFFLFYSTIVYSFLAGSIWAVALFAHDRAQAPFIRRHLYAAIILSLIPLIGYFLATGYHVMVMLLAFLLLLFWEKLFLHTVYPHWYQQLRHRITFIVVACHMLVIWNLMRP